MKALHDSRSEVFRTPYGAVPQGDAVRLSLDVWDAQNATCELRLWTDEQGESRHSMQATQLDDHLRFSCEMTFQEPHIVWYSFIIHTPDSPDVFYSAQDGHVGGVGVLRDYIGPSFQMTVYKPRQTKPDWYTGGIVYQIFPDRFARGTDWQERAAKAQNLHPQGPSRHVVQDWDEPPTYKRDDNGRILQWDFYGGTLRGIQEHLDYLADMGVTVLYLNPIFEAASNHRYDTGNYMQIDPFLGDTQAFRDLAAAAAKKGIRLILDGVFNHTGCDSIYFNKYGNYDSVGAFQDENSPYRAWFNFGEDNSYSSWWGVGDLPDIQEHNPEYRSFMFGPDGVVRHWLKEGASGWRLDVADELPDDFIEQIKASALAEKDDALILGEVWEDASNKVSYGKLRSYFLGRELDSVMNYNLRRPLIDYVMGWQDAPALTEAIESMRENYPADAFNEALNMLGTHDTERILTTLGGAPAKDSLSDEQCSAYRLSSEQLSLAKGRLWLAVLLQMTLPGVPCIYYGDEAGLQGYADPYNRATFPWSHIDSDCQTIYRNAARLRTSVAALREGTFESLQLGPDIFGFARHLGREGQSAVVLVNRSNQTLTAQIPAYSPQANEVISGHLLHIKDGHITLALQPLGSAVILFESQARLGKAIERSSGVLAHITSLPAPRADVTPGTLGEASHSFVQWLANKSQRFWQVLPITPPDQFGSPYAGSSAFAGNISLIDARESSATLDANLAPAPLSATDQQAFEAFCKREASWLTPYTCYDALKQIHGGTSWQTWPQKHAHYSEALLANPEIAELANKSARQQFEFQRQWDALRSFAHTNGVSIIGDMPMYVAADSADVWAHPELFDLDAAGNPRVLAGAPPDVFSQDGQVWGNPVYRWDAMQKDGYAWWLARMQRAFALYDFVRLDHFLGFSAYYTIPAGASGKQGSWKPGPGLDLFQAMYERFGELPLIAEDLGVLTPAARALLAQTGFYGMEVAQFSDTFSLESWPVAQNKIVYTGTHDNQTLRGFFASHEDDQASVAHAAQAFVATEASNADLAIVQLQDVLGLDDSARMNTPGTTEGNWRWRATAEQLAAAGDTLAEATRASGRAE